MLPVPFLKTASAMAKSADDIARLLNVSDLDNSTLADIIGDYFVIVKKTEYVLTLDTTMYVLLIGVYMCS